MREATLVTDWEDLSQFFSWFGTRRGLLGVDTETTGLEWWTPQFVRLLTVSDGDTSWAIPMDRWRGVGDEVEKYHGEIVMHNAKFDLHALGWRRKVHDSMIAAHLVDPRPPHALKDLGVRHVEARANWYQRMLDADMKSYGWGWDTVPLNWPSYWEYGAYDPWLTVKLAERYLPMVRNNPLYDLELEFMQVIRRVEERGMRVDRTYCQDQVLSAEYRCGEIYDECVRDWGFGEEGPGSNAQVVAALVRTGVHLRHRTPGGAMSVTEEILSEIDHPISKLVLEYRHLQKRRGSWFKPFLEFADGDILHPDIRTMGARTARLSVSRPAMQTLPRGPMVRDGVIAREGHSILLADYKQAELRVLAHYAQDENMIAAFLAGEDLHQMLADAAGVDRQPAKNGWFSRVYGAGVPKFAETVGISEEAAAAIYKAIDDRFPGIRRFLREVESVAQDRLVQDGEGWVNTLWGRYQPADVGYEYKLANYLIQSTATADL
ncbi:MAG: DNA polymerase, partial [Actinobacteria bacterium]|nr:DNA polymerase [Actinomycetota bacterium]